MFVSKFLTQKTLLFQLSLLLLSATGRANDTDALSLDRAVRLALEKNPALQAAAGRVDSAAGRALQARAFNNPELELAADDWPLRSRGYSDSKKTMGLSQTVRFPGKRSLDRQVGAAGVRVSEAEGETLRLELVRDVKIAFSHVLTLERQVELAEKLIEIANASAQSAQKRVEAGAAPLQEQLRAEVQAEQVRTEALTLQRELAEARRSLAMLLGLAELAPSVKLVGEIVDTPDEKLLLPGANEALARHPLMRASQARLDRAELESRRARLEPYPDVKVGVAAGEAGESGQSIGQVSLSLPLPLLDRGKGSRQEARANANVARAELRAVQLQLQRDFTDAAGRYRSACGQVANFRSRLLPKAAEALRLVQAGYEEGKFGIIDLLDTQRTTAEAQSAYQVRLLEMCAARAELEALSAAPIPQS